MKAIKSNPDKTVLVISVGFGIIFLLLDVRWALYISLAVGGAGVLSDKASKAIDFLWMKLAKLLSFIMPNILLSMIFYLLLFPISLLSKVFGNKDSLRLKNEGDSMWVEKESNFDKSSLEKMW